MAAAVVLVGLEDDPPPAPELRIADASEGVASAAPAALVWPRPQPGLWRFMPDAPLTPRVGHAIAVADDAVVVWGGFDVAGLPLTDGALFDPAAGRWELLPPVAAGGGTATHVASSGADVVVVSATSTLVFHADRRTWTRLPPPPLPDGHVLTDQVVGTGDGIAALTRPGRDGGPPRPGLLRFERANGVWHRMPDPPVRFAEGDVLLAAPDRVVVISRALLGNAPQGAQLELRPGAAWRWIALPPGLGDRPLVRLLGAMAGDRGLLVGIGVPGARGYAAVDDGRGWRRTDPPPLPASPLVDGLWVGDGLIVWNRLTGAGAQLGLRSARWTRFADSPVADGTPRPAAWTGSTIVTWGGLDPAGAVYRVR